MRHKGVSEEDWYYAYPSTLNNRAPIGCVHSILGVTDQIDQLFELQGGGDPHTDRLTEL